ncbi:MAG: HDOD domain-containing protein [Candidatus Krumholzibacteriia bacterium]
MNQTLKDLIAGTHELAALPQTTARLLELVEEPDVPASRLLRVIELDPALTANLLRLCNSAYYGRRREVGAVGEALVVLGTRTVVTLAFATSMGKVLRGGLSGYGMAKDELWRHALAVACGAATIVVDEGREDLRDRAFTAGLVHDIGKLLLDRILARGMEWEPLADGRSDWLEVERQVAGFDHAEAGAALADCWRFPEALVEAIRRHHESAPTGVSADLATAVRAADAVAAAGGVAGTGRGSPSAPALESFGDLGVAPEILRHVAARLALQLDELTGLFAVPSESRLTVPV